MALTRLLFVEEAKAVHQLVARRPDPSGLDSALSWPGASHRRSASASPSPRVPRESDAILRGPSWGL